MAKATKYKEIKKPQYQKLSNISASLARDNRKIVVSLSKVDSKAQKLIFTIDLKVSGKWKKLLSKTYGKSSSRSFSIPFDYYHQKANDNKKTLTAIRVTVQAKVTTNIVENGKTVTNKKAKTKTTTQKIWKAGLVSEKKVMTYDIDVPKDVVSAITFTTDGNILTYGYDNPDANIMSNNKHTIFRQTYCLLRKKSINDKKWSNVSDYDWSASDSKSYTKSVSNINTPTKYQVLSRSHGPAGVQSFDPTNMKKSGSSRKEIILAKPNQPVISEIVRTNSNTTAHTYRITASTKVDEWHPIDTSGFHIQYADYSEAGETKSWQNVDLSFSRSIDKQSFTLPRPDVDCRRIFRVQSSRFGMESNSTDSFARFGFYDISDLTELSGMNIELQTVGGKETLHITWNLPNVKFEDASLMIYRYPTGNGKNQVAVTRNPIKYNSKADSVWQSCSYDYDISDTVINKETFRFELTLAGPGKFFNFNGKKYTIDPVKVNSYIVGVSIPSIVKNLKAQKYSETVAKLTWDNKNIDSAYNGLEVAWSTSLYDIEENSTASVSTHQFDNAAITSCLVTDLSASDTYYFWVRAYIKKDDVYTYAPWSVHSKSIIVVDGVETELNGALYLTDKPNNPVFGASRTWINQGDTVAFEWDYTSSMPQTSATIYARYVDDRVYTLYTPIYTVSGDVRKASVTFSKEKFMEGKFAIKVRISNIAGFVDSEDVDLLITSKPTFTLNVPSVITKEYSTIEVVDGVESTITLTRNELNSLPITINTTATDTNNKLLLHINNVNEYDWNHANRTEYLYPNDCVYTSELVIGDNQISNIRLADGNWYRIDVDCVNNETGLKADTQSVEFFVNWTKQAKQPVDSVIEIDEEGRAVITPIKPEGAYDTDACNVYRNTMDGLTVCKIGAKWGTQLVDTLPTFGLATSEKMQSYRVALITEENDEAWVDLYYSLDDITGTIITYGDDEVALPWDVDYSDDRSKNGELREHLGGTKLYFSKPFVSVTPSISAKIIKGEHDDILEKLYELSRYTGICYIRTSRSLGFTANVNVSISQNHNDPFVNVSLSMTECDANGEYEAEQDD